MISLKLSVLDQSPIHDGKKPKEGLFDSIKLAIRCEELGYFRYWCAEHHDTPGYASANPEIMVSSIANRTKTMRVGSGGVMLNHYSSFKVAETFNTLTALHENRIDLGIGRASGANFLAARALHNSNSMDYVKKARDLINYLDDNIPENDYFYGVNLSPKGVDSTPVYFLGSSDGSSVLAGRLGAGFCLALFIGTHERPVEIMKYYRDNFIPSKNFKKPKAMLAVACICAESKEKAQEIASSHTFWKVQAFRHAKRDGLYSPNDVRKLYEKLSSDDKAYYHETLDSMILGTPAQCKKELEFLAKEYEVDEIMIVNVTYSFEDRIKSYELLAKEFNLIR
ncbi:LLM class flavin-dependent oxidoreductase [Aliarcobacter cibarius]|uniref:LLM class flavin-dependent oxidoreductase n=1 Tax=Aliarcobacter cibarius TaxID=255507 RepID=A0ABY2V376_9BACT|nr:LLM class flavin-dependent oxidoreductase [Aliarcobacter cibarius]TLS97248.1 LLM class flavin-dependent oxidoreductase [Aliarcobacter cibarius]TLS97802.1 LLM class flavin-dependent oxidoreductase [Aliarcobacter cibarius]